jgi:hypothetical protein
MPRIEQEYLIASQAASPETDILIKSFYSTFDNRGGANKRIVNVESLHYNGLIVLSEFLTYAPTKMYLCLSCLTSASAADLANRPYVGFYDSSDFSVVNIANTESHFDSTFLGVGEHQFAANPVLVKNFYFSRLLTVGYTSIVFTGWRMTLV